MTREQLSAALDLAEAGCGPAAIGRQLGVHREAVRGAFRERGIKTKPPAPARPTIRGKGKPERRPWTEFDDFRLVEMFGLNRTDSEIARNLGRSHDDVRLRRRALRLRRGFGG